MKGVVGMENNLVVQANDLVQATYAMTVKEKEVLVACISQIDSRVDASYVNKFIVTVEQMKQVFNKTGGKTNLFRDLQSACDKLYDRQVCISLEGGKTLKTRFVSAVMFDPLQAEVRLTFADDILPYLTQLHANFTKYKLLEISGLSSIHAVRLYELIVCWAGQYQYSKKFEIDEFKYTMGIEGKYKNFSQLRERVIDVAIEEINQNTNYKISVEYHKRGSGKAYRELSLKFHKKVLDKLAGTDGGLSIEAVKAIVDSPQFMLDYNNHPSLTHNGKNNTEDFKREMFNIIQREPETFKKKPLDGYLAKIK